MRVHFKTTIILFTIFLNQCNGKTFELYTAAVVEYNAIEGIHDNVVQNEKRHEEIIEEAKKQGADIIVFPELSLNGLENDVDVSMIPDPEARISPCDVKSSIEPIRKLSCASRKFQIYTVVNIVEEVDCAFSLISQCKSGKEKVIFNSDVVLDRSGRVIARHRKYHFFNEDMDKPSEPQITYFDTDFGVRFGVLTCFEILFEYPGRSLVEDFGIRNIIILTAWSSGLPYHLGSESMFGWAYTNNVNLLVAGLNSVNNGSTGTGIFRGKYEILANVISDSNATQLLVGQLYKEVEGPYLPEIASGNVSSNISLSVLGSLEDGAHELIRNTEFDLMLCHHDLCCHFYGSSRQKSRNAFYRAYVFDGVANFQNMGTGGTQSCLIILCLDETIESCARRSIGGDFFNSLSISGSFRRNHALQIPTAVRGDGKLTLMQPTQFIHKINCIDDSCWNVINIQQPIDHVLVFGIYGRDYTKDGLPHGKLITDVGRSVHGR